MSAYITHLTPMLEQDCLLAALADVGISRQKVEVHAQPVALVGYEGQQRQQSAHLVIRRQHIGSASNDLGFLFSPTGYKAIISDDDERRFDAAWLSRLTDRYEVHAQAKLQRLAEEERRKAEEARLRLIEAQKSAVYEKAKKLGYLVKESRQGDAVRLVLVKRSY